MRDIKRLEQARLNFTNIPKTKMTIKEQLDERHGSLDNYKYL